MLIGQLVFRFTVNNYHQTSCVHCFKIQHVLLMCMFHSNKDDTCWGRSGNRVGQKDNLNPILINIDWSTRLPLHRQQVKSITYIQPVVSELHSFLVMRSMFLGSLDQLHEIKGKFYVQLLHCWSLEQIFTMAQTNYRPQRSYEGYVFTPVCPRGGGLPQCMLGYYQSPLAEQALPPAGTPLWR